METKNKSFRKKTGNKEVLKNRNPFYFVLFYIHSTRKYVSSTHLKDYFFNEVHRIYWNFFLKILHKQKKFLMKWEFYIVILILLLSKPSCCSIEKFGNMAHFQFPVFYELTAFFGMQGIGKESAEFGCVIYHSIFISHAVQ